MRSPAADLVHGHADHAAQEEAGDHQPRDDREQGHPGREQPPIIPGADGRRCKSHGDPLAERGSNNRGQHRQRPRAPVPPVKPPGFADGCEANVGHAVSTSTMAGPLPPTRPLPVAVFIPTSLAPRGRLELAQRTIRLFAGVSVIGIQGVIDREGYVIGSSPPIGAAAPASSPAGL